jgi:hypothetical protein
MEHEPRNARRRGIAAAAVAASAMAVTVPVSGALAGAGDSSARDPARGETRSSDLDVQGPREERGRDRDCPKDRDGRERDQGASGSTAPDARQL